MRRIIFGIHAVEQAFKAGEAVDKVWLQKDSNNKRLQKLKQLLDRHHVISVESVSTAHLDQMCAEKHQGVVAEIAQAALKTERQLKNDVNDWQVPLILVLDGLEDPRNLGACLRSAAAAGVTAVIISKNQSAPITATTHKTAAGAIAHLDIYQVSNMARALEIIKAAGVWVYGTDCDTGSTSIYQQSLTGSVALVMGNEGTGLRHLVKQTCDHLVHIPMSADWDSLNVAVATGVVLFEAVRQRSQKS
ncbi:23S rRNA (guanosine-2'-O-)-methyltransferase RlmB [Marinicella pacifica]|uniref:23S rRNA (Guanosine-2'-O-)-methyltransferase RlmB n=1 Tax=Marinicella pacifica TaxID=1171543 RepID=A0A917CVW9_9GAMM|nr:23S rRNA (guanosine(2251)-2'-O)-methyltransferase RlmB [Marinicella pacifica]GGG01535.1 23S rRNA (guanosine-2'-O-)-methyltransferase RlmB [Marinicella pacifica]